jgi:hypothetical protein
MHHHIYNIFIAHEISAITFLGINRFQLPGIGKAFSIYGRSDIELT